MRLEGNWIALYFDRLTPSKSSEGQKEGKYPIFPFVRGNRSDSIKKSGLYRHFFRAFFLPFLADYSTLFPVSIHCLYEMIALLFAIMSTFGGPRSRSLIDYR
jgi:hypothetical protein